MQHQPVLLAETLSQLQIIPNGIYLDATFGRGGHSASILAQLGQNGRLLAMDQDPEAATCAQQQFASDKRVIFNRRSFTQMAQWVNQMGLLGCVNGVLMDIGLSSPQLDNPERGFSFLRDGPLDMRMDCTQGETAAMWIANASASEMVKIFKRYGEERFANRIAAAIVRARQINAIVSTSQLAHIVAQAHPRWPPHIHPATKVFQAIRIHINQELTALSLGLAQSVQVLAQGGRLAVITFHSLEAQCVKHFVRQMNSVSDDFNAPSMLPVMKWIQSKIKPSAKEIEENPRARSALLRVMEKLR